MDDRYATALAAAAASKANLGGSPNGGGQEMVNLQNLAQLQFTAGGAERATGAFTGNAKATADQEEAQRQAAAKAAEVEQAKKDNYEKALAEMQDPKNYRQEIADDGGYHFYDPMGNKIDVQKYSRAVGKQIPDVLKDSQNQNDARFVQDYKDLLDYGRALAGDEDNVKKFRDDKKYSGFLQRYKDKSYGQVVTDFKKSYTDKFQPTQLDTLRSKSADGKTNITGDTISPDGKASWTDWLMGKQRSKGVNYR